MSPLDLHELILWSTIIAIVVVTVITGRWLNRFLTYRAHRLALEELRRRAMESHPSRCSDDVSSGHLSPMPVEMRSKS